MTLEWLRRHDPCSTSSLRTYLFTEGSILALERGGPSREGGEAGGGGAGDGSLGIGALRGEEQR